MTYTIDMSEEMAERITSAVLRHGKVTDLHVSKTD